MSPEELLQSTLDAAGEHRLRIGWLDDGGDGQPAYARENEHAYTAHGMRDEAFVPEDVALSLATQLHEARVALAAIAALQPACPHRNDIPDAETYGWAWGRYCVAEMARKALVQP